MSEDFTDRRAALDYATFSILSIAELFDDDENRFALLIEHLKQEHAMRVARAHIQRRFQQVM